MSVDHRISPLKKSDLQYTYTKGAAGDDNPALRGSPDNKLLNRSEWYEMLYFCNKFANECGKEDKGIALKTERLIKGDIVPSNLHSHANITQWLLDNWSKYPNA